MSKKKIYWGEVLVVLVGIVLAIMLISMIAIAVSTEEVETYSFHAEITHMDSNSYYKKNRGVTTEYIVAVSDGDFNHVFKVNGSYYAGHKIGELVEIECKVMENLVSEYNEYSLIN